MESAGKILHLLLCKIMLLSGVYFSKLPFKILGHFYSGQCEYTEAVLANVASCIELKAISQHTEGVSITLL